MDLIIYTLLTRMAAAFFACFVVTFLLIIEP